MFHLILMLCLPQGCSAFDFPKVFPTEAACLSEGSVQATDHLIHKDGDGGVSIGGFICLKS